MLRTDYKSVQAFLYFSYSGTSRLAGIIKDEYLECYQVKNIKEAKELLKEVVKLYNEERPHMSIGYLKPEQLHQNNQETEKLWKTYYSKSRKLVNQLQD